MMASNGGRTSHHDTDRAQALAEWRLRTDERLEQVEEQSAATTKQLGELVAQLRLLIRIIPAVTVVAPVLWWLFTQLHR